MNENIDHYDDIINLPHPEPFNHARMSMLARAAQFAPFAALTGHDAAIAETGRYTHEQIELGEAVAEELDRTMAILQEHILEHPTVRVTHFVPDERKAGGSYATVTAPVKRIDPDTRSIVLADGTAIALATIITLHIV